MAKHIQLNRQFNRENEEFVCYEPHQYIHTIYTKWVQLNNWHLSFKCHFMSEPYHAQVQHQTFTICELLRHEVSKHDPN